MKGLLFSRVMRTDTYFMSRSRAPPPLPPASVFQTVVPLLLNLFVSLFEPSVKTPLIVFVLLASTEFFFVSLLYWLFPSLLVLSLFCTLFLSRHPVSNNKQFPEIAGDTPVLLLCPPINLSDCGCCRSAVFVVVIVDKTRSTWQRWFWFVMVLNWHFAFAPNKMK